MKALIVGSGSISNVELLKDRHAWADLVIAADGGAFHLMKSSLLPHVLVGDFDSLPASVLKEIRVHNDVEILTFPVKKDYTDLELAINLAIERGATELVIMGASGSRLDHTTANILLLNNLLEKGIKGCIEDENNQIYLIQDALTIKKQDNRKVSLLSLTPTVEGLTTKGLSYALCNATLKFGSSRGISNEFLEDIASITLKKGLLLVFLSKD